MRNKEVTHVFAAGLGALVLACGVSCKTPTKSQQPGTVSHDVVASFRNPFLDLNGARAGEVLRKVLEEHGIRSSYCGSAGVSLVIESPGRVDEARELVRQTIAAYKLQAQVIE